ncbi:YncE family protein [Aquimarina agarilytica]|uniref:YncE family protein n=1 Tax=Aquimarina agarilytica TaxID=1087449 RepID=UPI0002881364|nr:YncE family protein [Aquimarina agarilytica]
MHKNAYLGLAALTSVGIGAYIVSKLQKVTKAPIEVDPSMVTNEEDQYVNSWSPEEINSPKYKKWLAKWGTKQGVIDVGSTAKKRNEKRVQPKKNKSNFKRIAQQGEVLAKDFKVPQSYSPDVSSFQEHQSYLAAHFETTQVTLSNNTDQFQKVDLWGANSRVETTEVVAKTEQSALQIPVGVHPQNALYNPKNNLFYVVNQLSDSVSVLDTSGAIVAEVTLGSGFVGGISPVDITLNTNSSSSTYGYVYVVGSVSNAMYEIDLNFNVISSIPTGKRPIAIEFNEFNDSLYIANLVSHDLTKVEVGSRVTTTITGANGTHIRTPWAIGIQQSNGNIYVFNSTLQYLTVFNSEYNKLVTSQISVETHRGSFGYNPETKQLYFAATDRNYIAVLSETFFGVEATIAVGNAPNAIVYHPVRKQLFVANKGDQDYTVISNDNTVVERFTSFEFDTGLAISSKEDVILNSSITTNSVGLTKDVVIKSEPAVTFNSNYEEYRENFQHNPAVIEHIKVIHSGAQSINALQFIERSISGKEVCKTLSLNKYASPQHFNNTSEIHGAKGAVIDGKNTWSLKIPPKQRVTLLLYHKQFDTYQLLPETARKSTGVTMSKGLLNNAF